MPRISCSSYLDSLWDERLVAAQLLFRKFSLSLSLYIYIYIYICLCVCVCVYVCLCLCVCVDINISTYIYIYIYKVSWPTLVEGDLKALFSIASIPGYTRGHYSFPCIDPLTLDLYLIILSVKQGGIKHHFLSLCYDSTWDWTVVSRAINKHLNHYANGMKSQEIGVDQNLSEILKHSIIHIYDMSNANRKSWMKTSIPNFGQSSLKEYSYHHLVVPLARISWPSIATSPYRSSPLADLQGYILYPHIAAECIFWLVVQLLLGHMWGSIGVHHLWARPCFSSSVLRIWFV